MAIPLANGGPKDFDPLPRMAAIYGMAELCGVGHRKAPKTCFSNFENQNVDEMIDF